MPNVNNLLRKAVILSASLSILLLPSSASAVIVNGGNGSEYNTSTPAADFPYWDHVGEWRNSGGSLTATCLYLGDSWVLTANHAWVLDGGDLATVKFDGTSYNIIAGSNVRITNSDDTGADMMKFRIDSDPGLSNIPKDNIVSSTPSVGAEVYMMGYGRDREATMQTWHGDKKGYYWNSDRYKRWGTNNIDAIPAEPADGTYGKTWYFTTRWDLTGGDNEAQGTSGDSGGAVFVKDGATWKLAGMIFSADFYNDGKYYSLYDTLTYSADMSVYRSQVPEPSVLVLLGIGAALLLIRRRRTV